jgi:aryl-alcohol dehydrogenase-like predicted oxidoreductase
MINRRTILSVLGSAPAAGLVFRRPAVAQTARHLNHRLLGRTGRWVVPYAFGGQASVQRTPDGIDPVDIVVRAVEQGINYLDTANGYGPSQVNYGHAFRKLRLIPGEPDYRSSLRSNIFLATKTGRRFAKDPGGEGPTAVDELKRSLTQMFGDGQGHIPDGAYLDSMQIHNLTTMEQVEQIYEGVDARGGKMPERIGTLAALLDYRDGTNYTGLNPEGKKWIRHIGVTGHLSSAVLMNAIQRDRDNTIVDTLLVALNVNDRAYSSHQYNVIPLARARGLGVIAMKLFSDGVFYGKEYRFSRTPADTILTVGGKGKVSPADLVRYPLGVPGVSCAIVGIGRVDRSNAENDQLLVNMTAGLQDVATANEMLAIERRVAERHGTETNYFQEKHGLIQPTGVKTEKDSDRILVRWNTGFAGPDPIRTYNIYAGDKLLAAVPYRPQLTLDPLSFPVRAVDVGGAPIRVVAAV